MKPFSLDPPSSCARWLRLAVVAAAVLVSAPQTAAADDRAAAEALFTEGRKALDAKEIDVACQKFEASLKLDPALGTLLNLAKCHGMQGRTATAWVEYRDAAAQARREGQMPRAIGAEKLGAELEATLPKTRVRVAQPAAEGLVVLLDGKELAAGSFDTALPIDPGRHAFEARAPGRTPWKYALTIPSAAVEIEVDVPELQVEKAEEDARPSTPPTPPAPEDTFPMWPGLVAGSSGVVLLGIGTVLGVMTLSDASTAEDPSLCPAKRCTPAGRQFVDAATAQGTLATVLIGIGAAAAAGGGVLVGISLADSPDEANAALDLSPTSARLRVTW